MLGLTYMVLQVTPSAAEAVLADQGFAGLDASHMSTADKQAAFERMVLGESADVLDIEMATLQASPRKQSLSITPLDTTSMRHASNRKSPNLTASSTSLTGMSAGDLVDSQHVVSFEGGAGHGSLAAPKAVEPLTLPRRKSTSSSEKAGCCVVS